MSRGFVISVLVLRRLNRRGLPLLGYFVWLKTTMIPSTDLRADLASGQTYRPRFRT